MEDVAHQATETAHEAVNAGAKSFEAGASAIHEGAEKMAAQTDAAFKEAADRSLNALNELNAQSKRNLEAVMASVTAATRGAESLGSQAMGYAKSSVENHVAAAKAMSGARSVQEVLELQSSYARKAMETYMAELNKASETITSVMKDTMKPLNERATAAVESVQAAR